MKNLSFYFGIIGVCLFVITTVIAGIVYPNYNPISQFISESYAVDAPFANPIRYYGYMPSGISILLFSYFAYQSFPKSNLSLWSFLGIGIGYGLGTIICSIFNCDAGCNPEFIHPSISQIIHNTSGMFTYLVVPFSILGFGISARKNTNGNQLSNISIVLALVSFSFVILLNQNLNSPYKGLIQRIIEGSILLWILYVAFASKKSYQQL